MRSTRSTRSTLIALLLVTAAATGCRKPKADPMKGLTVAKLLDQGETQLKRGKFEEARRTLRRLEENFPSSPEFPAAKLLIADSFFFAGIPSYPEALVEYQSFLNYFPRHERRDYALYHAALSNYASIESAERDQSETHKAIAAFERVVKEHPGSPYVVEAKAKITQGWRRIAEHELMVGIFYVNFYTFGPAEQRLKGLLETYPNYVDRERVYFYLAEALRQKFVPGDQLQRFQKDFLAKLQKEDVAKLDAAQLAQLRAELDKRAKEAIAGYREEAKSYYQKLVESYPKGEWSAKAKDRLIEMGQAGVKEELDS